MTGRIVFMTEERSMAETLRCVLPRAFPGFVEREHWLTIAHSGKASLESSFPKKMQAWHEPGVRFVILRDNDGADCVQLKDRLRESLRPSPPDHRIRIVCQELESWFLGDLGAVASAYPHAARHSSFSTCARRDPDSLTNASDLVSQLTGTRAKLLRAQRISAHLDPNRNRSHSFRALIAGVRALRSARA